MEGGGALNSLFTELNDLSEELLKQLSDIKQHIVEQKAKIDQLESDLEEIKNSRSSLSQPKSKAKLKVFVADFSDDRFTSKLTDDLQARYSDQLDMTYIKADKSKNELLTLFKDSKRKDYLYIHLNKATSPTQIRHYLDADFNKYGLNTDEILKGFKGVFLIWYYGSSKQPEDFIKDIGYPSTFLLFKISNGEVEFHITEYSNFLGEFFKIIKKINK